MQSLTCPLKCVTDPQLNCQMPVLDDSGALYTLKNTHTCINKERVHATHASRFFLLLRYL